MKPKLRGIKTQPSAQGGQPGLLLSDPLGISPETLFVPNYLALLLSLMDGTRDTSTLETGYLLRSGRTVPISVLESLVQALDEAYFLENERFAQAYQRTLSEYRSAPSRQPGMVGKCYPSNTTELESFLGHYFGLAAESDGFQEAGEVRGLVSPHIDYARGGLVYAKVWSWASEAVDQADLVVILGTDHNEGAGRITLTRQNYATPWGLIPTDQDVVSEFVNRLGQSVFEHELNHLAEHSIELALIWLHYLRRNRPFRLLPILCGSFTPFIESREEPIKAPHIASAVELLRSLVQGKRALIVAAADLAHQGPVFGDPAPLDFAGKADMTMQDKKLIEIICTGSASSFFHSIQCEHDRRHICGLSPIYLTLLALQNAQGRSVSYLQCPASEDGSSSVSICGVLFNRPSVRTI